MYEPGPSELWSDVNLITFYLNNLNIRIWAAEFFNDIRLIM